MPKGTGQDRTGRGGMEMELPADSYRTGHAGEILSQRSICTARYGAQRARRSETQLVSRPPHGTAAAPSTASVPRVDPFYLDILPAVFEYKMVGL